MGLKQGIVSAIEYYLSEGYSANDIKQILFDCLKSGTIDEKHYIFSLLFLREVTR